MTNTTTHSTVRRLPTRADSLAQVKSIRELVAAHALQFQASQKSPVTGIQPGHRRLFQQADLKERKDWAAQLTGDAKKTVQVHLEKAEKLGATRRVAISPHPDAFGGLERDFPHFSEVTDLVKRSVALCRLGTEQLFQIRPVLLAGNPGVGKTAYAEALANLLSSGLEVRVPFAKVDVGTLTSSFSLSGLDVSYTSAKPGLVWDLLQSQCMSAVIVLDELDKIGNDTQSSHLGPLYGLLERVSSKKFVDGAIGLPVDASYISWLATCNDAESVEGALRSRFKVINIPNPSREQMRNVVRSIHRQQMHGADWAEAFEPELTEEVIDALCDHTPREVGQALEDAFATAATQGQRKLSAENIRTRGVNSRRSIGFTN